MLITAERVVIDGEPHREVGVVVDDVGRIQQVGPLEGLGEPDLDFAGQVMLPGFINAHSHAFQRLLRGRTQVTGGTEDNFWTWRAAMYRVASRLDPDSAYVASRQAFLEMLLAGVTTVGEFHYVHHQPDGTPYDDPVELDMAVVQAALDVGIRLGMLRVIYFQGDFGKPAEDLQRRFCDDDLDAAWKGIDALFGKMAKFSDPRLFWGVAAHSVRAVPYEDIVAIKACVAHVPFHIHVSEQRKEVEGCLAAYGLAPVELLARGGVLDSETTLVHATHLRMGEARLIANSGASVCVCPSTEADLADGLVVASDLYKMGVPLSLGTDGQTLSSILEEARRLEMHERLRTGRRNVLARGHGAQVARTILECATANGGRSADVKAGQVAPGYWGDFVTFDLDDPMLAGWDDTSLVASLIFSADARSVRNVVIGGDVVVEEGHHPLTVESTEAFGETSRRIFGD